MESPKEILGWIFMGDTSNTIRYDKRINETYYYCYIFTATNSSRSLRFIHSYGVHYGEYRNVLSVPIDTEQFSRSNISKILKNVSDEIFIKEI